MALGRYSLLGEPGAKLREVVKMAEKVLLARIVYMIVLALAYTFARGRERNMGK